MAEMNLQQLLDKIDRIKSDIAKKELGAEGRQTPEECEVHRSILGALGNSIVPNVAFRIIQATLEAETESEWEEDGDGSKMEDVT